MPFDPSLPIVVQCDASPTGIAGALSHIVDGVERPVAFVSRSLSKAEQNYSQLDHEALAIVFTVYKFYMYLYGNKFVLETDNRPLTRIFNEKAKLPPMTASRLLRYAAFLQAFDYQIRYRKGEENTNADYLSRATSSSSIGIDTVLNQEVEELNCQIINKISTRNRKRSSIVRSKEKSY